MSKYNAYSKHQKCFQARWNNHFDYPANDIYQTVIRNQAPPEKFSTRKAGSMPGTLCYRWHVVKTSSGDGVNGEEADHGINDLTGELRWKTF
jgi:hypothetical protein